MQNDHLISQEWRNLRAAERPLTLVCHYNGRSDEAFTLPPITGSCKFTVAKIKIFECRS